MFEIAKGSGTITTLASFNGTNGAHPKAGVIEDGSGDLFGTTRRWRVCGTARCSRLLNGSGTITTLASFNGTNGLDPDGGSDRGLQRQSLRHHGGGGAYGDGTVFEIVNGSGTITTLASFNGTNGANPDGGVIEDSNGNLFGTTSEGGAYEDGTVFEIVNGSGTITTLASFNGTNGADPLGRRDRGLQRQSLRHHRLRWRCRRRHGVRGCQREAARSPPSPRSMAPTAPIPSGAVIEDSSGNLFGTTHDGGGAYGDGTVFEVVSGQRYDHHARLVQWQPTGPIPMPA